MTYGTTDQQRTITAFFENRQDANKAIERLVSAGVHRSDISLVEGAGGVTVQPTQSDEATGFWESLKDLFLPGEDRSAYAEGLRRGGYLIAVRASAALHEQALDILDEEGTIDINERATSWREEGWTGYGADARTMTAGTGGPDEVIPLTEEQLKVGKRDVSHGRVRVRSYVVEEPVEEQVNLRQEHVHVERRPVDRPATGAETEFKERAFEAEESAEEAVVSKEARVREEVVVNKDVGQRTEKVSDKVRRTEVEVEDERGTPARAREGKPR